LPILELQNLTKRFGDFTAVDHLNLEVNAGEIFGLLGHNGAGKTTTINVIVGLLPPTEGTAKVNGHDIATEPIEARRNIGLMPDSAGVYFNLTGRQNLSYFGELANLPTKVTDERTNELLKLVKLDDWATVKAGKYSRGMKQRLGIAQSLIRDPSLLIYDEPTLGIDPEGTREIRDTIYELAKTRGKTIVLATHLLGEVSRLCDRVAIMGHGKLLAVGTIPELRSQLQLEESSDLEDIFMRFQGAI